MTYKKRRENVYMRSGSSSAKHKKGGDKIPGGNFIHSRSFSVMPSLWRGKRPKPFSLLMKSFFLLGFSLNVFLFSLIYTQPQLYGFSSIFLLNENLFFCGWRYKNNKSDVCVCALVRREGWNIFRFFAIFSNVSFWRTRNAKRVFTNFPSSSSLSHDAA
jgi:hypothetical protein